MLNARSVHAHTHTHKLQQWRIEDFSVIFMFRTNYLELGERIELLRKTVSGIMLTLLLTSMLTLTFNIQPAKAWTGTVYIEADGSVYPPDAPIRRIGNLYTLTDDIISRKTGIIVERDNIIIDGAGFSIFGTGERMIDHQITEGISLHGSGVTIMNVEIKAFGVGIWLIGSSNNYIFRNTIVDQVNSIVLWESSYNIISENRITEGICIYKGSQNVISDNIIEADDSGIGTGIHLAAAPSNIIKGNTIRNYCYGIGFDESSTNMIYHNNFIDNKNQVYDLSWKYWDVEPSLNTWDDGYPSGGNYWSDYAGIDESSGPFQDETGSDGIGDTPYVIDENNQDNYPLMNPWTPTPPTPPPKFRIGDWVHTTANLNVREGPGLSYIIISTMPLGTIGQIVDGPVEADGFVWWEVDYAVGVRGWSAENWLELALPPACVVKLQKNGAEINEVKVWEFFDIYVGDSAGHKPIKAVRFSSDDVQDGIPTGEWTDWYDWSVSSGDWDSSTKIKRWAFATPGYKEVWAEVKDEASHSNLDSDVIFVPAPALPVLTSPLVFTPVKDIYNVGDSLEAEFTIENVGDTPITLDVLTVGGRFNGGKLSNGEFPDFTFQKVTLRPGQPYQYHGSLTLTQQGNYHFFVAYHIENPTSGEKNLLDENYWNTNVELREGLTHTDRVKNIIVYKEGTAPEEVSQLNETINRWIKIERIIPTYLPDPEVSRVASVWMTINSIWTHALDEYDELWLAGVDYSSMSQIEAVYAKRFLDRGDIDSAREHLQNSYLYDKISYLYFDAATQVFDNNMKAAIKTVKSALKLIEYGVTLTNPMAGKFASYFFTIPNYIADRELVGEEEAGRNLVRDLAFKVIFSEFKHPELGDRTFKDYLNNRIGKITFPIVQKIFENNKALQFYIMKAIKEIAVVEGMEWLSKKAEGLSEKIVNELSQRFESCIYEKHSPVELRVYDSKGKITGVVNGTVRHEISRSFYKNGTITILFPSDPYTCEVTGKEEGTYGLEVSYVEAWNITTFNATNIPISTNATHQYTISWDVLSTGQEGVTVQVDTDGDGVFEHTFTSDSELTQQEYIIGTDKTPPQTSLNIGEPRLVVDDITYLTSATSIELILEDNPGGSGVALTAYRIYNASYDSGWITYTQPFYLTGLSDGTYQIDYNSTDCAGNVEPTNTVTVILDNTPPKTILTIGEPKYVSDTIYVAPDTPFILEANDVGSGVYSTGYRICNNTYDSGWIPYTAPFYLTALTDGVYTIEFYSTDNLGNIEATCSIQVTLFSWDYIFTDSYGRETILKINTEHEFFQFITPDKDYGIREATYMRVRRRRIIIWHKDSELRLITLAIDTKLDFCVAIAWDVETHTRYFLIDKPGKE